MASSSAPPVSPAALVRAEAAALEDLALRLDQTMLPAFHATVDLVLDALSGDHRLVTTGIGKSGLVAQKFAATLRSTGTPASFLHPSEALHGDLGLLLPGDPVLLLSSSGDTPELLALLPALARLPAPVIALCGRAGSPIAREATLFLDCTIATEACPHNLAPTASTAVMLALADALALSIAHRRGFAPEDFADRHPGGQLGRRLARVRDLMHTGDAMPTVAPDCLLPELIHEMSRKKLGVTLVMQNGNLLGIISDGDLRRLLETDGALALSRTAGEILHPDPASISPDSFASEALALLEARRITAVVAVSPSGQPVGIVHLHDLWHIPSS